MAGPFALVHTDVVDSTALGTRIGEAAMTALWRAHLRGSRDLMRRWNGREVDNSDGLMLLFEHAADAMAFADDYHRLLDHSLPQQLKARVGVHLGALELRENSAEDIARGARSVEVMGTSKVIAARLMALALGGQTLVSATCAHALEGTGWLLVRHGHWRMKGLDEPMEVWEAGSNAARFAPPPDGPKAQRVVRSGDRWAPLTEVWHSLPAERDAFVGRAAELLDLRRRLADGARLVTLHGAGGIGKTRLALRHGWTRLGDHLGGVAFCDLSAATTADGVVHAVAQGMLLPLGHEPLAQIGRAIAGRGSCLVIVDNAEQVIEPVREAIGRWLDAAPAAQFIVTSRTTLGVPGEVVLALDVLSKPDGTALFHARAAAASSHYEPPAADSIAVDALVDRLDALPLAIELAAARVPTLSLPQLLARLDQRFRLLSSPGGRPGRQATLRATLDWSWDLLDAIERDALLQLSVFEGGFTLAAAEAVLDLSAHGTEPLVPDLLGALVGHSLVRSDGAGRFTQLRSVQEYLRRRVDPAAASELERRHWRHMAGLDETRLAAAPLEDLDNKVAACRRAAAAGDAEAAVRCLVAAWLGLRLRGPLRVVDAMAASIRALPALTPALRLESEWVAASACFAAGALAEAALACARGLAGEAPAAPTLRMLTIAGEIAAAQGDTDRAAVCFERATQLLAAGGIDAASHCHLLNALGLFAADAGQVAQARAWYERALAVVEMLGERRWQGGVLGNLGWLAQSQGDLTEAVVFYRRALALSEASGDLRWEGNMRCNLGLACQGLGRAAEAGAQLRAAGEIARRVGLPLLESVVECNLGIVASAGGAGESSVALQHFSRAVQLAVVSDDLRTAAQAGAYLACALCRAGDLPGARRALAQMRLHDAELRDALAVGIACCAEAEIAAATGDTGLAAAALAEAQALRQREGWYETSELGSWLEATARRLQLPRFGIVGS
ncbi:MAG: tetratricopeptide repeat protein [Piscinibacter sp.]|nr:tetratricopeptide repeat protein [Piscinibacter sp.]